MDSRNPRESGVALILSLIFMMALLAFTAISVDVVKTHAVVTRSEERLFAARQIAESGVAQAMARLKEAGQTAPVSGNTTAAQWIPFGDGEFYYSSTFDLATQLSAITAWGRVPVGTAVSGSTVSPLDVTWDGSGYLVQGLEVTIKSSRYIPKTPMYFGNGGFERPLNGFLNYGTDAFDPTTWGKVTSPDSTQAASVPMVINALDHPYDYLVNGGAPKPQGMGNHPFSAMVSQNLIGQMNTEAWFNYSAAGGSALAGVIPTVASYSAIPSDSDYVFPVDPLVADVQDFSWNLWGNYENDPISTKLAAGSLSGTFGDIVTPGITFVTGGLTVAAGNKFSGAGILVIRDDFDPNIDTNNQPAIRANLDIAGTFEWTGLVIIAGWAPGVTVRSGGDATIVGSLMGEDSVMSGGELSLESATISMNIQDDLRLLYSYEMFEPGGMLYDYLPQLRKEVIAARDLYAK